MRVHRKDGIPKPEVLARGISVIQRKLGIFLEWGYKPHIWALAGFHANLNEQTGLIARFRFLVAGRRGGKSFSAAREVLVYALYPDLWWEEVRGITFDDPSDAPGLWIWIVAKDHVQGWPTYVIWKQALDAAGLIKGVDYHENMTNRRFTFPGSGTVVEFRIAEDPDKLVGAGLHVIWWDEAAKIRTRDAWDKARPTLGDHLGIALFTTTPEGKDWVWEEGWSPEALSDPDVGTVEFWSIDNPHFPKQDWEAVRKRYHPALFKQQYMADFTALQGKDLHADWLHYYGGGNGELDLPDEMDFYIGVDPAISQRKGADRFVITALGVDKKTGQVFLVEQLATQLPFPEQVNLIESWHKRYRPVMIGVEAVAYQSALVQQISTLPSFPPVTPVAAKGEKASRIIAMSPLFKFGRILIRRDHRDFIEEWVSYDSSKTHNKDDTLDSVQIALSVAGAIQQGEQLDVPDTGDRQLSAHETSARRELQRLRERGTESDLSWVDTYDEEYV